MILKARIIILGVIILTFAGGVGVGYWLIPRPASPQGDTRAPFSLEGVLPSGNVDFDTLEDVWETIHSQYVDRNVLDDSALIYGAIRGMLDALEDPFTTFFDPEETENFLANVNGTFEGIGAEIEIRDDALVVVAPLKDTPAYHAGLKPQDHIVEIDGESTEGITLETAVANIRGEKGTTVSLLIGRENRAPFEIPIVRGTIHIPSAEWKEDGGIASISFYSFTENSSRDFEKIAREIADAHIQGIILDLRGNPGGYLQEAVSVAGFLLPRDTLVLRESLGGGNEREHRAPGPSILADMPIVVLINEGSASASEILAGALRDARKVPVIGQKSFGKGSVQAFEELAGGASFKYTIARWFTPGGTSIQDEGITPDVVVGYDSESEEDAQFAEARKVLEELL